MKRSLQPAWFAPRADDPGRMSRCGCGGPAGFHNAIDEEAYRLLTTMTRNAGKVITHKQLLKEVWGPDSVYETPYLQNEEGGVLRILRFTAADLLAVE